MQIITDKPFPLLQRVKDRFKLEDADMGSVVFAYGDDLYSPVGANITPDLLMHEATHSLQQMNGADEWWDRYLAEDAFRLAQEVQAYRNQYAFVCKQVKDRNSRSRFLMKISKDLSSPLYGSICSFQDAYRLINQS